MVPQNIKINNVKSLDAKLLHDEYFDFMLHRGEVYGDGNMDECLTTSFDFNNPDTYTEDGGVQALDSWEGAKSSDIVLDQIGMVGVDNGLIAYDKYVITNKIFYDLFFNSKYEITSDDTKFRMHAVDGNTKAHSYDISVEEENGEHYIACRGGFLQGFFKLHGFDYQVLPDYIENDWMFEFVIRPRSDYETKHDIINNMYPDNAGTFFYIGTRAENKFAELMNKTSAYTENYVPSYTSYVGKPTEYYTYIDPEDDKVDYFRLKEFEEIEDYLSLNAEYYHYISPDEDYFINEMALELESYLAQEEDISLSGVTICAERNTDEIIDTDNKFLFFNRTCTGFTTHTWDNTIDSVRLIYQKRREYKTNAFLLFNRTCTGYTTHNIDEYFENTWDETDDYNIMKDVIGNAFSLKYNEDGSISYQYTMKDCDAEEGYSTQVETTLSGLVKDNEWNVIDIRFTILNNSYNTCVSTDESGNTIYKKVLKNIGNRKMKMMIYVNGYLVFISKDLNEFRFRELNDIAERQEGVPYNISLGGGTLGLGEKIWIDYLKPVTAHYYLERNYAGSFIGDLKMFKMFDCMKDYQTIKNNYKTIIINNGSY